MDDLISRKMAYQKMIDLYDEDVKAYGVSIPECFDCDRAIRALRELSSAQKKGRWIKKIIPSTLGYYECECSECGRMWQYREGWKYCPNCGARMENES